jgi:hypothetical protein
MEQKKRKTKKWNKSKKIILFKIEINYYQKRILIQIQILLNVLLLPEWKSFKCCPVHSKHLLELIVGEIILQFGRVNTFRELSLLKLLKRVCLVVLFE